MKKRIIVLVSVVLASSLCFAQDKVAEGEYQISSAGAHKTASKWVLFAKPSKGYRLEAEIQNQPAGLRVVQIEELTEQLVPTAIGYELYHRDELTPGIIANCDFAAGPVVCSGNAGQNRADPSIAYHPKGPFWPWIEGLSALDLPWLFDGALNMALSAKYPKAKITTLIVSGGSGVMIGDALNVAALQATNLPKEKLHVFAPQKPIPWSFKPDEGMTVEPPSKDTLELNGVKLTVKLFVSSEGEFWMTDSGMLLKITAGSEGGTYSLANFRQYKKLIPELPVEGAATNHAH